MTGKPYRYVEKQIRKKKFGILSTISPKGWIQSSTVQYGVSPKDSGLCLYVLTDSSYKKVKNIQETQKISFAITFPHYYLRFIPPWTVSFQGTAKILPFEDLQAREACTNRSLKRMIEFTENSKYKDTAVFLKLQPNRRLSWFGLGMKLRKMMKDPNMAHYSVDIP